MKSSGTTLRSVSGLDSGCEVLEDAWSMGTSIFKLIWGGRWTGWLQDLLHDKGLNMETRLELESERQTDSSGDIEQKYHWV